MSFLALFALAVSSRTAANGNELIVVTDDAGRNYTIESNGDGTFGDLTLRDDTGSRDRGAIVGDFDGDGVQDYIAGNGDSNTISPFLYSGNGDGTFKPRVALPSTSGSSSWFMDACSGDFDNDGSLDFIVNGNSTPMGFYWGRCDGTFEAERRILDGGSGRGMDSGDFNGDGNLDFVRARCCDGLVRLFLGNGDRTFASLLPVGDAGSDPYGVSAGDFNEDGDLDVLANSGSDGAVRFFAGNGDGTFEAPVVIPELDVNNYGALDSFDFDGDGHLDVILTAYTSRFVYFWPGNGDATFGTRVTINGRPSSNSLGIGVRDLLPAPLDLGIDALELVSLGDALSVSATGSDAALRDGYTWDFGDGTELSGQAVSHTYTSEGMYLIRLVHEKDGARQCRTARVTVQGAAPVANPGGPYALGESAASATSWTATLDGSGSTDDFGIVDYAWDFGDGQTGTGAIISHTWSGVGPWTVSLTVTDSSGLSNTALTTVSFSAGAPPIAAIVGPDVVDETAASSGSWSVGFTAAGSSDDVSIWKYEWNFGNGRTGTGFAPSTTYNAPGTYTVTLTVFDQAGQTAQATHEVTIVASAPPLAVISGPTLLTEAVATAGQWASDWDGSGSTDDTGIFRYEWDFGDGGTANGAQVSHDYSAVGSYIVKLTVTDNGLQTDATTQVVEVVANDPPVAVITAPQLTVEGALPLTLSASNSSDDFGILDYSWSLPDQQYDFAGAAIDTTQWNVSQSVTQSDRIVVNGSSPIGWGSTYFFNIAARVARGGTFEARVDTPTGTSYAMVGLKNLNFGSGHYNQLVHCIYFNNGNLRVYEAGSFRASVGSYSRGTSYDVRIVSKPGSGATYFIRPSGSGQAFSQIYDSSNRSEALMSFGADVNRGVFGFDDISVDNVSATGEEVTMAIPGGGDVTLTVRDNALQTATDTVTIQSVVGQPPLAVISGPSSGDIGVDLFFSGAASSDDNGIASYVWDFGDGSNLEFGEETSHFYTSAGDFDLTLTVTDYAGQQSVAVQTVSITGAGLVTAVPWRIVNDIEIPHETWSGNEAVLKAVAAYAALPIDYVWDFGDGSAPVSGTATNVTQAYGLEARHVYTGSEGTPFTATITITDANGASASDTYPLIIRPKSLETEVNVAIDDGLWYLHKTQERRSINASTRAGKWNFSGYEAGITSSAVQAFAINGHRIDSDGAQDPYVETVSRGVNHIMTTLRHRNIGVQAFGDPDVNGNGIGIEPNSNRPIYELGQVMDGIIAATNPDLISRAGPANVIGRPYGDILQDMIDMYSWGQSDSGANRGGWRYSWNQGPDNSACQWAAIGMIPAENVWGLTTPEWVKEQNLVWLNYSDSSNGFGYASAGSGHATTPSGMVQVAWLDIPRSNTLWSNGEQYLRNQWSSLIRGNNYYAWFAIAKAMRLQNPPVTQLERSGQTPKDWYLDPVDGLARTLVDRQNQTDGSWFSASWIRQKQYSTAWGIIILSSTLFQEAPVAVANVRPNPGAVGQEIRFDGSGSFHQDPTFDIVEYRWDFDDSDGIDFETPDAVGPIVTHAYGALDSFTATLQVKDNNDPPLFDTATINVEITIPPHPPTADAGGPYVAAVGEDVTLDGSGSFDIDEPEGDAIQSWDWEVDFEQPLDFDDGVSGETATYVGGFASAGTKNIGLRVTDQTATLFPQSGEPDLSDDDFTQVIVYNKVITDLAARPKNRKVQLTWTNPGGGNEVHHQQIFRSEVGPNIGFQKVGITHSTYSTYLDQGLELDKTYYYRVLVFEHLDENHLLGDPIGSSCTVLARTGRRSRDRNRLPIISSTAPTEATVGTTYSYQVVASDPEGRPLTYVLGTGPGGMTIDAATGLVTYDPVDGQEGVFEVFIEVNDTQGGTATESYQLVVLPRPNDDPIAEANGPYEGVRGDPIAFSSAGTSDPDGDALTYLWSFGDGQTSTDANPTHVYTASGSFTANLVVNDGRGGTGSDVAAVQIEEPNRPPTALVTGGDSFTLRLGETLEVDGSQSFDLDGDPLTYTWHWGDSTDDATGVTASHVYAAEGTYQACLSVDDGRGGLGVFEFIVEIGAPNNPPIPSLVVTEVGVNPGDQFTFDATGSTDADGDPLTFSWDFGDSSTTSGALVTHVYQTPGDFTVTLSVNDGFGSKEATTTVHVNAPPVFDSSPILSVDQDALYSYEVLVSDADGDALTVTLLTGPAGLVYSEATGIVSWTPGNDDVGTHDVALRVEDASSAAEQAYVLTVVDVNDPPNITSLPGTAVVEDSLYSYDVEATDIDDGGLTFSLDVAPTGMTINPTTGLVQWTPTGAQLGDAPVTVRVEDPRGGGDTQSYTITVSDFNDPPIITSSPVTNATENALYTYDADAVDEDDTGLVYSLVTGPAGMTMNPSSGLVQWTPTASGTVSAGFQVSDGRGGLDSQSWSITVANVNDAPQITSSPIVSAAADMLYSYDVEAIDEDGDTLSYALDLAPTGMTIDAASGLIQWTPTDAQVGDQPVSVRVDDTNGESDTQSYTITVQERNLPPEITSAPVTVGLEDELYQYDVEATDPNSNPLVFSLDLAPSGMTIDPVSGLVQWTPTAAQVGDSTVTVRVEDDFGESDSQSYTLSIAETNDAPEITSTPVTEGEPGFLYVYDVEASDEEGDALTYSLDTAPSGMTIDAASGLIQWSPTLAQLGDHAVTVRVEDVAGDADTQSWTIVVEDLPNPPEVGNIPGEVVLDPTPFATIALDDFVDDPDHADSEITWAFSGNSLFQVSIDSSNVATIVYTPGTLVTESVTFTATDPDGLSDAATAAFAVIDPATAGDPPGIDTISPSSAPASGPVTLSVSGTDFRPGVSVTLTRQDQLGVEIQPTELRIESSTSISVTFDVSGLPAGSWDLTIMNPNGDFAFVPDALDIAPAVTGGAAPTVTIAAPPADSDISIATDVLGSATDADGDLSYYVLQYSPVGDNNWTTFARGTSEVSSGVLGTLDPATIANGVYDVRIFAEDLAGNTSSSQTSFALSGEEKVGLFTISYVDVSLPIAGVPIQVIRKYDSRVRTTGDFGAGWSIEVSSIKLEENRLQGESWRQSVIGGFFPTYTLAPEGDHFVSIFWPDGVEEKFVPVANPQSSVLFPINFMSGVSFSPVAGSTSSLVPTGASASFYSGGIPGTGDIVDFSFNVYNPNGYVVTKRDGERYTFVKNGAGKRTHRLTRMEDTITGSTLDFNASGIIQTPSGVSVSFARDSFGRITSIMDPEGNVTSYTYDARGDLAAVTNPVGETTTFRYNSTHGLISITDPDGNQPARNEYDESGRLVAKTDARGNRIEFTHIPGSRQQIVTDKNGNDIIREYDESGNIISSTNSLGERTEYTYDSRGNKTSETDPEGRTASWTFDAFGNITSHTDFEGATTSTTYNSRNQVLSETDAVGNTTSNAYDARGNCLSTEVTDSSGALVSKTESSYDALGFLSTRTVFLTETETAETSYERDSRGNVGAQVQPDGSRTEFTYTPNGLRASDNTTRTLPDGSVIDLTTTYDYDELNRLESSTDPMGNSHGMSYDASKKPATQTDPFGNVTRWEYDAEGNQTREVRADGSVESFEYDAEDNRIAQIDRRGNVTRFEYDSANRQTKVILPDDTPGDDSDNPTRTTVYDRVGRVASKTDERGNTTTYAYVPKGGGEPRKEIVTDPIGNVTTHEYDDAGNRTAVVDALGRRTTFEFDGLHRLVSTTFHDGSTKSVEYDLGGRKSAEVDQSGRRTTFQFDSAPNKIPEGKFDDLDEVVDPLGNVTRFVHDEQGNRLSQTDASGNVTRFEYDELNRLVARVLPLGQRETFEYGRSKPTRKTDMNGEVTSYVYDEVERLVEEVLPDGSSILYEYTPTDKRAAVTDSRGRTTYEYNERDWLTLQTNPDGTTLAYTYDAAGNRTSVTSPAGTTSYAYDALSRLVRVTDPEGGETDYTYDAVGNRASVSYANGTTTSYAYDSLNRLTGVVNSDPAGALISSYTYTLAPHGVRTRVVEAGPGTAGRTVDYAYDDGDRLVSETIDAPGTANDRSIAYTYDEVGNRLTRVITIGNQVSTTNFVYDANDRLLSESTTVTIVSTPNAEGDRWAVVVWPVPTTDLPKFTVLGLAGLTLLGFLWLLMLRRREGPRRELRRLAFCRTVIFLVIPVTMASPQYVHAMSHRAVLEVSRASIAQASPSDVTYTYDDNGNVLTRTVGVDVDAYTYDGRNRLTGAVVESGSLPGTSTFAYDADNIRVAKAVDGVATTYLVDHTEEYPQVLVEATGASTVSYVYGDDLLSMTRPVAEGGTFTYLYDGTMSTRQLTGAAGAVTDTYDYDAFGNELAASGTTTNNYRYTGEQFDPNLGFQYLRARYYDPSTGRFMSQDPHPGNVHDPVSLHKYLYAGNDPVNKWDPTGEFTLVQIAIVSVIVGILAGLITYFLTGSVKKALIVGFAAAIIVAALMFLASYFLGWQFFYKGGAAWHFGIETAANWNIIHIGRHIKFGWHLAIGSIKPFVADIHIYIQRAFPFFRFWRPK